MTHLLGCKIGNAEKKTWAENLVLFKI